jgi:hypothetical protein
LLGGIRTKRGGLGGGRSFVGSKREDRWMDSDRTMGGENSPELPLFFKSGNGGKINNRPMCEIWFAMDAVGRDV